MAELLAKVDQINRLQADIVDLTARLQASAEDVEQTGIAAETWLAVEGRMTRSDRRMLAAVAEHLSRMPLTAREFSRGGLSWSQLRTITTMLVRDHRICADEWDAVDGAIASAVGEAADDDPDEVVRLVRDWLHARRPEVVEDAEADAHEGRFLALQPKLDGLGLRFWGETDAAGAALLESLTRPGLDQLPDADGLSPVGRMGRARHDQLMARLTAGAKGDGQLAPVTNLVTMDCATLVGLSQTAAELLVALTGGRLKVSGPTARRLLEDGFDNRLIVLDETGQVLGVGRKTRVPPGWLRDALLARDRTCTHPLCERPGLNCQADHAQPWNRGGTTDIDNVGLVCGPHNRDKEKTGWRVLGNPNGSRTWHHPRSGITVTTRPSTRPFRPPDPPPKPPIAGPATAESLPSPPAGADPPF